MIGFDETIKSVEAFQPRVCRGTVDAVRGMTMLVRQLKAPIGAVVRIERPNGTHQQRRLW